MTGTVPVTPSAASRALAQLLATSLRRTADVLSPRGAQLLLVREMFESTARRPLPRGTRVTPIGDLPGIWVHGRGAKPGRVLLFLHGGGFVFGSPRTHRHMIAKLSENTGMPAFVPDYRRAPEHPYPAAAVDVFAAYRWLLDQGYPAADIVLAADSAGGHLATGLLKELARRKMPMPAACVLMSPFLDLGCTELAERDREYRDPFVPPRYAKACADAYVGGLPMSTPGLDVLHGSKRRWPPTLIQVGDTECLLGDAQRLAALLSAAGVHRELQVWPGQVHAFPMFFPVIPEGRAALRLAGEFLRVADVRSVAA